MQTDGKQTLDDSLIIDSNGCIEYVRFDSAVAQAPDVQTEQPNEMCVAEGD